MPGPIKLNLASDLDLANEVEGSIAFHNGSSWEALAPNTDGKVLTTHGAGQPPTWEVGGVGGGSGDITGPLSVTNERIAVWDGTTGNLLKEVPVTIDGTGVVSGVTSLSVSSTFVIPVAAGAAPTTEGALAWDSTSDTLKAGTGGSTVTVADLSSTQSFSGSKTFQQPLNITGNIVSTGTGFGYGQEATPVAGNARGAGAIDLQTTRSAATKVAGGIFSAILSGRDNLASGTYGVIAGGYLCNATQSFTFATGYGSTAAGQYTNCFGYVGNLTSTSDYSIAAGHTPYSAGAGNAVFGRANNGIGSYGLAAGYQGLLGHNSSLVLGGGSFTGATTGDNQTQISHMMAITTDATLTNLYMLTGSAYFVIPVNSVWKFKLQVVGTQINSAGEVIQAATTAGWEASGVFIRNSTATCAFVGAPLNAIGTTFGTYDAGLERYHSQAPQWGTAPWTVGIRCDASGSRFFVQVTGEAAKTIRWAATLTLTKIANS